MKKLIIIFSLFMCLFIGIMCLATTNIEAATPKMRLNVKRLVLTKNQQYTLRVYNSKKKYKIYFTTEQEGIISLQKTPLTGRAIRFTAINSGVATVIATVKNNKKVVQRFTCNITVTPPAISVKFKKKNFGMLLGKTLLLKPIIKPNNSSCIPIFTSSDEKIAIVNARGRVYPLSSGEVTITATLPTGQSTSCTIAIFHPIPWAQ